MDKKEYIEEYVGINGLKQYFLHYPYESDLVILYLHDGPGQSEAQFAYCAKDDRLKCNVVYYDQRGTGKTQLKNKTKPETVTLSVLLDDLKDTVLYLKEKYQTEKIILVGHSWGSVLGTMYIKRNPHDVMCYVGVGQIVDMKRNEKAIYEKLGEIIEESGNEKDKVEFAKYEGYPYKIPKEYFTNAALGLRSLQSKYGLMGDSKKIAAVFKKSPVYRFRDLNAMLSCAKTNKNLMDRLYTYSIYDNPEFKLPVFFICGRDDWQTPGTVVEEYFSKVYAPGKDLYWVENAGHMMLIDNPKGYNDAF
jgi:pimeloyl-ACP methyl ester carboxylesterase